MDIKIIDNNKGGKYLALDTIILSTNHYKSA